tara:strand:- start:175 stop:399 length:225 start_codon:yes stop_codon:yes gene_type:complete
MPQIEFEHETTDGLILRVTADIRIGRRGYSADRNGPGEQDEESTINIVKVEVKKFEEALEELEGAAWSRYEGEI